MHWQNLIQRSQNECSWQIMFFFFHFSFFAACWKRWQGIPFQTQSVTSCTYTTEYNPYSDIEERTIGKWNSKNLKTNCFGFVLFCVTFRPWSMKTFSKLRFDCFWWKEGGFVEIHWQRAIYRPVSSQRCVKFR